jgi:energy-converting hydrogenase Eha subunit C
MDIGQLRPTGGESPSPRDAGSASTTGATALGTDLDLLRAFEPIVCYTNGELFFPTAVGPYVSCCSLWGAESDTPATCIVPAGALTLERLCQEGVVHQDRPLSLRFVQRPLDRAEYRRWRRAPRDRLSATARFTTTGMFGRLVDAGIRASLLLRGKVAAGLSAAAEITYRERLEADRFTYYGRVVRDGGYVCLQYWFFYAMNDWRSRFGGVNDHEADWELVIVYLAEQEHGPPRPAWVACSSHDHYGDDLRRRWDDPDLRRDGNHPVVFAGAGSHSGAFTPGDYVISVDPPQLRKVIARLRRLQRLLAPWRDEARPVAGFGIPFVDYARGDGKEIGSGRQAQWTATLIGDETPWVRDYRGLWGLDTEDRFGGERAPSGPRYERNGTVRPAWANALGWSGLLKVAPRDDVATDLLAERIHALERELTELDERIAAERSALRGLRIQVRSLEAHDYARDRAESRRAETVVREAELNQLIAARTRAAEERRAHLATLSHGIRPEPAQAHFRAPHGPRSDEQERRTRFLRLWGIVSTPLLLASVIVILVARPLAWITTIALLGVSFVGVEAFARRRFLSFLASLLLLAASLVLVVGFLVLFHKHWRIALSVIFGVAALALLIGNLGDVRHGWRRTRAARDDAEP